MLKFLRSKKQSTIIYVILGAIILVFVFWGMFTGGGGGAPDIVAKVDGKSIKTVDYQKAYRRQLEQYRNLLKGQMSDDVLEQLNLKERTLDSMVNRALIVKDAKRKGIKLTKNDLKSAIQKIPDFQVDGSFNKERYLSVLQANRMMPNEFEEGYREDMIIQRAQEVVLKDLSVSDEEVKDLFSVENRTVNLNYLTVDAKSFDKTVEVSDEEAEAFLEENKEAFRVPAKIKVAYASLFFKDLVKEAKVPEADIKSYYEENISTFEIPKEVQASHILIRPSKKTDDSGNDDGEAQKRAEDILSQLRKGKGFAALAKQYSEDPGSAKKGGELGYFKRGDMVKPFENAAFSLKAGETSDIVKSDFGYHIIKVTDVKEARTLPIEDVRDDILLVLNLEEARELARERMESLQRLFDDDRPIDEIEEAASKEGARFVTTGYLTKNERIDDVARYDRLRQEAFSMDAGEVSGMLELPHGVYILKVVERDDSHLPAYDEVSDKVDEIVKKRKALQQAREKADAILNALNEGKSIEDIASAEKLTLNESGFISKVDGSIPGIGKNIGEKEGLFTLTEETPHYPEPLQYGSTFYIFSLKGSREADQKLFEAKREELRKRLLTKKQEEAMTAWITEMRSKAKIEVNRSAL
ncbi:MAG: SurA N-terminal domain-containing protein [Thermodesulfobacteriota bacterium]